MGGKNVTPPHSFQQRYATHPTVSMLSLSLQVEKINIDYAKTAKKFDVKRLKTRMWEFISQPNKERPSQEQSNEANNEEDQSKV